MLAGCGLLAGLHVLCVCELAGTAADLIGRCGVGPCVLVLLGFGLGVRVCGLVLRAGGGWMSEVMSVRRASGGCLGARRR